MSGLAILNQCFGTVFLNWTARRQMVALDQGLLMPRTKQRTPELRDRVLAVAVDLLAEEGAAGLTARSLAARADTSAPALYELFGDKSGVVRELYFEGFRQLSERAGGAARRRPTRSPTCGALATAYRRFIRANRELAEVMFSRPFTDFSPDRTSWRRRARSASSSWAGCGGASRRAACAATRPTSPMSSSR